MSDRLSYNVPLQRREQILHWLKEDQLLRVDELAGRLGVSRMTVYRDLNALAEERLVEKVHGGVRLPDPQTITTGTCTLCHMPLKTRTHFAITTADNQTIRACCAHCGLLLLNSRQDVVTALLRDFIYGRIVNVQQAHYVVESRISICCQPSVLAFAGAEDASDFQRGFGGWVMDFAAVRRHLSHSHNLTDGK